MFLVLLEFLTSHGAVTQVKSLSIIMSPKWNNFILHINTKILFCTILIYSEISPKMQLSSNLKKDCSLLFWETLPGDGHHFRNLLKAMPLCWYLSPQHLYLSPPASCLSADSKPPLWCRLPITLLHVYHQHAWAFMHWNTHYLIISCISLFPLCARSRHYIKCFIITGRGRF